MAANIKSMKAKSPSAKDMINEATQTAINADDKNTQMDVKGVQRYGAERARREAGDAETNWRSRMTEDGKSPRELDQRSIGIKYGDGGAVGGRLAGADPRERDFVNKVSAQKKAEKKYNGR